VPPACRNEEGARVPVHAWLSPEHAALCLTPSGQLLPKQCWPHGDMILHFEPLLSQAFCFRQLQTTGAILGLGLILHTSEDCFSGSRVV
jgi:hypothetical protein